MKIFQLRKLSCRSKKRLWKMYVPKDKGVINYKDFLIKLGINAERYRQYFPNNKISQDLYPSRKKSKDASNILKNEQSIRQAVKQKKVDPAIQELPVEEAIPIFLDKLRKNENLLKTTFPLFDYEKNGEVSFPDFCIVINFGVMALPSKLFDQICKKLDIDISSDSKIRYQDFLDKYATANGKQPFQKEAMKLDNIPVVQKIKNNCSCPKACLLAIFTKGNEADSCEITRNELKRILSLDLKLKVSEDDFKALIKLLDPENTNIINSMDFLKIFDDSNENTNDTDEWLVTVNKLTNIKSTCSAELPIEEVEEMLHECILSRKTKMLKDFKFLDICKVGVVCKDDARSVINKFSFRFNDKQFEELWKNFPRNKFDQLLYHKFLDEYSNPEMKQNFHPMKDKYSDAGSGEKTKTDSNLSLPKAKYHQKNMQKPLENRKSEKELLYSEAPHLQKIIERMESAIVRNFRTIRFHLHRIDSKLSGVVQFKALVNILKKLGIQISAEDQFHILEYFDKSLSGNINYRDFLRIFAWYA